MEEYKSCTDGQCERTKCRCGAAPFLGGLLVALAFGWWVFPGLMFSQEDQPILFNHSIHLTKVDLIEGCADCHTFREDGSFTGTPNIEKCSECHTSINTEKPGPNAPAIEVARYNSEKKVVEEHVGKNIPINWKVHQYQPDNVFFSHATHFEKCYKCHTTMRGEFDLGSPEQPEKLCMKCHPSIAELSTVPPVEVNVLTNYSSTTMKMATCEKCHAHPAHYFNNGRNTRAVANNACSTCHK